MRGHAQRGTLIVEFAVILPVLILLTLIATEGANMFRVSEVVNNAAREGARLSIQPANYYQGLNSLSNGTHYTNPAACTFSTSTTTSTFPVCQGVANYIQNNTLLGNLMIQCPTVTVNVDQLYAPPSDSGSQHYSQVSVVCAYSLQYLPSLPFYSIPKTINISRTTVFFNLY
jgi:Flp pilus assembly protein TadG